MDLKEEISSSDNEFDSLVFVEILYIVDVTEITDINNISLYEKGHECKGLKRFK